MPDIQQLAYDFRQALNHLKETGFLDTVPCFEHFPSGSCGITCELLSEYLLEHGVYTEYVCGRKYPYSHAWLVVADRDTILLRQQEQHQLRTCDSGCTIVTKGNTISIHINPDAVYPKKPNHRAALRGRTIIDITGDQFSTYKEFNHFDTAVYVGEMSPFHKLFKSFDIHECCGLSKPDSDLFRRYSPLYSELKKHLR